MGSRSETEAEPVPSGEAEQSVSRIPVKRYGEYNLIGRLGFGGMAEVFLAFTAGPGDVRKLVVVKRLHRHLRESKDFVRMFLDEARLAAQLSHPNVVQTYELGEIRGSYFMSMEYLQGQSFDRLLRLEDRGDPVLWNQLVARVLRDALDGLDYAHKFEDIDGRPLKIIHRDVSPQNIFVTYEGISKVLDFGVAKAATQMDTTESGVLKGKCSYVAPEQAYGEKVDRRADLWAMGVVLWEGLAGRRLFKSETNAATLLEVLTAEIPLIMDIAPGTSLALGQVLEKSLQRDPKNRYTSAAQMKRDLNQYLREVETPFSRQEVGAFLVRNFADIRHRQQKVVEECLSDALASRPKKKKRGPDLQRLPASKSVSRLISMNSSDNEVDATDLRASNSQVEILVQSEKSPSLKADWPTTGSSSEPSLSQPSLTPLPAMPIESLRQKLTFGLLVLVLALAAAVAVAMIYQSFRSPRRTPVTSAPNASIISSPPALGESPLSEMSEGQLDAGVALTRGLAVASVTTNDGDGSVAGSSADAAAANEGSTTPLIASEVGFLTFDTNPRTRVSLGGRDLGTTPLVRRSLPAGTHILRLRNEEEGITSTYRVVIRSGETTVRRLGVGVVE